MNKLILTAVLSVLLSLSGYGRELQYEHLGNGRTKVWITGGILSNNILTSSLTFQVQGGLIVKTSALTPPWGFNTEKAVDYPNGYPYSGGTWESFGHSGTFNHWVVVQWDNSQYHFINLVTRYGFLGLFRKVHTYDFWSLPNVQQIQNIQTPTSCKSTNFSYSVNQIPNASYQWYLPSGWKSWYKNGNAVSGNAMPYPATSFASGHVSVKVTMPNGDEHWRRFVVHAPATPTVAFDRSVLSICTKNSANVIVKPSILTGTAPFKDAVWSYNSGTPQYTTQNTSIGGLALPKGQLSINKNQYTGFRLGKITTTVEDANGCKASASIDVTNEASGWRASAPYTGTAQQPAFNNTNIIRNKEGDIFYVGADQNIWTYEWDESKSKWVNKQILDFRDPIQAKSQLVYEGDVLEEENPGEEADTARRILFIDGTNTIQKAIVWEWDNDVTDGNSSSEDYDVQIDGRATRGDAKSHLYVHNQELYYLTLSNDIKKGMSPLISLTGTLTSPTFSVIGDVLYYVEDNVLKGINTNTQASVAIPWNTVKEGSHLEAFGNQLYFIDGSSQLKYLEAGQIKSTVWVSGVIDKNFSINTVTGTVYVRTGTGTNTNIVQVYQDPYWKQNSLSSNSAIRGVHQFMKWSSPNLFYVSDDNNKIKMTFFMTNGCAPVSFRKGKHSPEDEINASKEAVVNELSIFPNPAVTTVNLGFTTPSNTVNVTIQDLLGNTVLTQEVATNTGTVEVTQNIEMLSAGMYIVTVKNGNELIGTQKLIVK